MDLVSPLIRKLEHGVDLTDADRAVLSALPRRAQKVAAKTDLIREGDPCNAVNLVLEGVACRYKMLPDGEIQIVGLILPGDFCHLHSAILEHSDHSVRTLSPCTLVELTQDQIYALTEHPRIARALWWSSLVDEAVLREWLTNMGQREADQRTAHLLCEILVRMQAVRMADDNSFVFPVTQANLGHILGMTPVHINRVLQRLRMAGLVIYASKHVEIPDVERLKAFCDFNSGYLHFQRKRAV